MSALAPHQIMIRHCERGEAIQSRAFWIAAAPAAPRNDEEAANV
ncbi:hypothetical protein [Qipengyuania sp.]